MTDDVRELKELVATLQARVEQLEADAAGRRSEPSSSGPTVLERAPAEPAEPIDQPVGRRQAIKRAGLIAAGSVAGGAAIVAATSAPAAAATMTGSGDPGVLAVGIGGPGVQANTNQLGEAAVDASTGTANAKAIDARHTGGGNAATFSSTGSVATVVVEQTGSGMALDVSSDGSYGIWVLGPTVAAAMTGDDVGIRVNGRKANIELQSTFDAPPARSIAHTRGMVSMDDKGIVWLCIAAGTPGTWRQLGGPATAGALTVLPAPARVYDSRPGTQPAVGTKTKLTPNVARVVDLTVNSSKVPAGATAALLTILLVNAAPNDANFTVWANGVTKPVANTLVWGGTAGRFTATAVSALDAAAKVQVSASAATDVVVDVVGFYR